MLILTCPCCGVTAEETEFHQGGEAHLVRSGPEASEEEFHGYLFAKENPKGPHFERWRHIYGCGKWFIAARDTLTLEIYGTYPAQTVEPPQAVCDAISAKRPGWTWRHLA